MTVSAVEVVLIKGRFTVLVSGPALPVIAALVDRAHGAYVRNGRVPIIEAIELVDACRQAHALAQTVPPTEPRRDSTAAPARTWLTTAQAARALAITERAVRKRIATGNLPAQDIGGRWAIDPKDVHRAAAS